MAEFDVDAARKAGYSDDEILQHLTTSRNFDINGAVKAGYSKAEIINHLAGTGPAQSSATSVPTEPQQVKPSQSSAAQLMFGATPSDLGERLTGAARAVGKVGMGALQYGQYLAGAKVSPTPLFLEPKTPNEEVGRKVANAAMTMAPSAATGGAPLAVRAAVGAATGGIVGSEGGPEAAKTGAILGGAAPVAGQLASETMDRIGKYIDDKELAAKIWNRVARVKAGQGGTQMDMATGDLKTLPGRAMVEASQKTSPISQALEAALAKPDDQTRAAAYRELSQSGAELVGKLKQSPSQIDISDLINLNSKKANEALEAAGINTNIRGANWVKPDIAHKVTQELGDRINWSPNVLNDSNEDLKGAWSSIRGQVENAAGGVKADYKRWQEAYLFTKALQKTMEKAANNPIGPALKAAKGLGAAGLGAAAAEYAARNLVGQ